MNMKQHTPRKSVALAAGLCFLLAAPASQAGPLQTQCNPVNFGGLYWGSPASWEALGIPHYQWDTPGDGVNNRDLNFISVAHDDSYFYVRYSCKLAPAFGGDWNIWLDTDLNPSTGVRNWSGNGSIGSEKLVTGAALIQDIGAWTVAWLNWDQTDWNSSEVAREAIFSINRWDQLPGLTSFDFTGQLYGSGLSDWYPDSADSQSGGFFRYTTTPLPGPAASSEAYQKVVRNDAPLAYYRLNETAPYTPDVAANNGALGTLGNGAYIIGAKHGVAGALAGDGDTAARFAAVDPSSTDGGTPVVVRWPEHPLIRELWDNVGVGLLGGMGGGSTSLGLDSSANWQVNAGGHIMKVAQDFDITPPPGPPYSRGQAAGLWADGGDLGGLSDVWDTRAWATRALASDTQVNFGASGEYWITVRVNNGGDTAMGVGLASGGDTSAQFVGVGAIWNTATGQDSVDAANSLYISSGTLGGGDGPYTINAHSPAGTINGRGLIVAHLTTTPSGASTLEAAVYQAGDVIPADSTGFTPQVTYSFTSTMLATHLLVWLNGDVSVDPFGGQLDAIRVATSYASMFQGEMNTSGSFSVEAWLRPTLDGASNGQSPLFNRDPNDAVANRAGWDFFQRNSGTGWNFRMFNGVGNHKAFDLTGGPYTVGTWNHLVAVYDASAGGSASLYPEWRSGSGSANFAGGRLCSDTLRALVHRRLL